MAATTAINPCDKFPLEAAAIVEVALIGFLAFILISGSYFMYLLCGLTAVITFILLIYIGLPFVWHFSPTVQRHILYMHKLRWTSGRDYFLPSKHDISGARNFYLADLERLKFKTNSKASSNCSTVNKGREIGVWQILPRSLLSEFKTATQESTSENTPEPTNSEINPNNFHWNSSLLSGHPIVVYFHGNMDTRANKHRVELYKLLQDLDMHVITFDYAGFADSTKINPTESSTVKDGLLVLDWISSCLSRVGSESNVAKKNIAKNVPVILWGHSLGTGVASAVLSKLQATIIDKNLVSGLILEAPFTSIPDAVMCHPIAKAYCFWPKHKWLFCGSMKSNDMSYETFEHLYKVPSTFPIQILHSLNDSVIPYHNCQKLINLLKIRRGTMNIKLNNFVQLNTLMAHAYICRCPELPEIIKQFILQY